MKNGKLENRIIGLTSFIFFFLILIPCITANVYKPYLHNAIVPEHPGLNIQGVYETELCPGAATYYYPIEVPPGRLGLQPTISLNYNSILTNQRPGIIGTAWVLTENYILRDVNYSFSNPSDDTFKLVLDGNLYNLVYDPSDGRYHTEIESYFYIQNLSGGNSTQNLQYWEVKEKDGTIYRFGYNPDSELVSNLYSYTVKWSLDLISDTHDNNIYYSYSENPYSNDSGAVYPYRIEYNNDKSRVIEFVLENSDMPDGWLVYEQGNKVRESRRIGEIQVKANGNLVRKYVLNYTTLDSDSRSFLSSLIIYGNDNVSTLPPTTFEYHNVSKGWQKDDKFIRPPISFEAGGSDYGVRLLDLNRDGLIDIIKADGLNPQLNQSWVNNGSGWGRNDSWNIPEYIVNTDQYDTGVRFIDFNGDGFTDMVRGDGSTRKSYQNSGAGWLGDNSSWYLPTNAQPVDTGAGIYERGVRFEDLNNDGLVDILSATDDWNYAWINNGSGWTLDNSWKVSSEARFIIYPSGEDEGVRLEDVNGDGLIDLVKGKVNANRKTWLNNGSGWVEDPSWTIPFDANFASNSGEDEGVRLADINGDGLVDIIKGNASKYEDTWINNGSGWSEDQSWNIPERANFVDAGGANEGVRIADVNGDGLTDLINGGDKEITFTNMAAKSYLLKKINNNLGGSTVINYIKSSDFDNRGEDNVSDMGFNIWVVDLTSENNSINDAHNLVSNTNYYYTGGYYDNDKKEFRGFNRVDEIKPNLTVTKHWFNQSHGLKYKEYMTEIFDTNSNPFKIIEYNWNESQQNNYYTVILSEKTDYLYDGTYDSPKITQIKYSYDNYGNPLTITYLGDNSTQNDEKYEYLEYIYNTSNWIVNTPKHYELYDYDNTTKVKEIFYRYDNLSYGSTPLKGDLTWKEQWSNTGNNSVTQYDYRSDCNLMAVTDPNGYQTRYNYGIRELTNTSIDQIINPKNHAINYQYDLGTGNLLWKTDPNGYLTNYTYDTFGRINKEILSYDDFNYPTKEYTYIFDGSAPEAIKITQRENSNNSATIDSYYFYDGQGNLIQYKTEADDYMQIVQDLYYDSLQRIVTIGNPNFAPVDDNYSTPNLSISTTDYYYDPLSMIIKIKSQDGSTENTTFDHWIVTDYDKNGNKKVYQLNAYNQIIKVVEYVGNNYFITTYAYNPQGDMTKINDSYGNVHNYTYDSLGRKTKEETPDLGVWEYTYDNSGNLITQRDNRGINISMQYDELNRIINKSTSTESMEYYYDDINGTLSKVTTSSLIVNFSYDNRLRPVKEIYIMDGQTFEKQWTYDSLDRITNEILPDNSIISYNYTNGGLIKQISDILDNVQYNPTNKPTTISYRNTLNTNILYDPDTYKIKKIKTNNQQDLDYGYDPVGNIIGINDSINNYTISMSYDQLDRLLYANKNGVNQNNFIFNYTYDILGNILETSESSNTTYYYNTNHIYTPRVITS